MKPQVGVGPLHTCSKCGEVRAVSMFQLYKGRPNGQCRVCKTASERARRARLGVPARKASKVEGSNKLCCACDRMKPTSEFSPSKRGLEGVASYCKPCTARKARGTGRASKATAAYRKRHPERHRANHRVRMFEYRTAKKVTADGSVTDGFLKLLYAQVRCHYCGKSTREGERTADHRVPLARGGAHTAENLVMACWTCNCSKRDMSEEEFIKRMKK